MATNPLSTTFGGVEGEGYIKISVGTGQAATTVLPSQFSEECFVEVVVNTGNLYNSWIIYNPGSTTAPQFVLANGSSAVGVGTGVPTISIANNAAYTTAYTIYFYKDADGKCSIRQNNNGTAANREARTVWIRKIG